MATVRHNERAWAIDLIHEINKLASSIERPVKRAGGESTVVDGRERLFPDVLLYGDRESGSILQGWELKLPDTPTTDQDLIENARRKAIALGLNSFLIWNVSRAVLYVSEDGKKYEPVETRWKELPHLNTRDKVFSPEAKTEWISLAREIIFELNDYFETGRLKPRQIVDSLREGNIADVILRNSVIVQQALSENARKDARFEAEIDLWWKTSKKEYPSEKNAWSVLSRIILISWINKLILANVLKAYDSGARDVENIVPGTTAGHAVGVFKKISEKCDFWNVFQPQMGEDCLPEKAWDDLVQLNGFLSQIDFVGIDKETLHQILRSAIYASKRKIAGQYSTPPVLAELLSRITVENKNECVYDPFCGTGTIAKAVYDIKCESGLGNDMALSTVWASDKFAFPLQMASLLMASPDNKGKVSKVFKKDIADLEVGEQIAFLHPYGHGFENETLPVMGAIVSNLPFVRFEDYKKANPNIVNILSKIKDQTGVEITAKSKSDLFAYLPFFLWLLLKDEGRLGIIIANSWLATDWGASFRANLLRFFNLERVVTSGKGRWFKEADVVANVLTLRKKKIGPETSKESKKEVVRFISLTNSLDEMKDSLKDVASCIIAEKEARDFYEARGYTLEEIERLEHAGLEWCALFADVRWVLEIEDRFVKVNSIFKVGRGERRGWDELFYPKDSSGIEREYLAPVLKTTKSVQGYFAKPDGFAFCCSKKVGELKALGHNGALSWINKFKLQVNGNGTPLPQVLCRPKHEWYELKDTARADIVTNINADKRLFFAKTVKPSLVNQRAVSFSMIENGKVDIDLCHALLNSAASIFFLEALGFGRGLGVLDNNPTKIKNKMPMLNPSKISGKQAAEIKSKFALLAKRKVLPIMEEFEDERRKEYDDAVFAAYGIDHLKDKIIVAYKTLYRNRFSVKDS